MNGPQRSRPKKQRKRQQQKNRATVDLWQRVPELEPPDPIRPTPDPSALIVSLGPPPLDQSDLAGQYFAAVIERAATVANALAASVGLLADDPEE